VPDTFFKESRMTRSILLAGLFGGLLGGGGVFAAVRLAGATPDQAKAEQPQASAAPAEARGVAEAFLAKLKDMKYQEFVGDVKEGMTFLNEPEFEAFKKAFLDSRTQCHGVYGKLTGEYELVRETAPRPELVRFVYLEKFERGAVAWSFVLYRTKEGWRLNDVRFNINLLHAFPGSA
jgi:hypothetical protein